jgi:hypothetical protein
MPKPTTTTDIVVISSQGTKETVKIVLNSDITDDGNGVDTRTPINIKRDRLGMNDLDSDPIIVALDYNQQALELACRVEMEFGSLANEANLTSTAAWGTVSGNTSNLDTFRWANSSAQSLIKKMSLSVDGSYQGGTLTVSSHHSQNGNTKVLDVDFKVGSTVVGTLKLTTDMAAKRV